jgi:serine/threonine protein kinase
MCESYATERSSRIIGLGKAIRYVILILEGLACLHNRSVIHRDIIVSDLSLGDRVYRPD